MERKAVCLEQKQQLASHYQELFSSDDLNERLLLLKEVSMKDKAEREKGKKLAATDEQYKKKIEQVLSEESGGCACSETPELSKARLLHCAMAS